MAGDKVRIKGAREDHLTALLGKLEAAGAVMKRYEEAIEISRPSAILPVDVITAPYPDCPTDLQAQWIAFMTQAEGSSVIRDDIYVDRFAHVPELVRLGARISLEGNTATIEGPTELVGAPVMSTDIRASASLVLAALVAKGTSEISRVYHLDRGYETIEKKLTALGARMERVADDRRLQKG
ncbi:UDP-N-acetylglucosamine 1-carboxyvinyltransferase [subsurface metagenome]